MLKKRAQDLNSVQNGLGPVAFAEHLLPPASKREKVQTSTTLRALYHPSHQSP